MGRYGLPPLSMDSSRVLVDVPTHRFAASCAEEVSRNIRLTRVPDTGAHDIARCIEDYHTTCARACNGHCLEGAEDRVEEWMHREAELMFNNLVGEHPGDYRYEFLREYHQNAQHINFVWLVPSKGKDTDDGTCMQYIGKGCYEKGVTKGVEIGMAKGMSKGVAKGSEKGYSRDSAKRKT